MRKKIVAALMSAVLVVSLAGCGESSKVALGEYKGLAMELGEVSDEDVDSYVESNLITPNTDHEQIKTGKVKDGDTVNIDYVGKKDGEAFEGGTAQGYDLQIGSSTFIDGFEEGLIGTKVGDTVDLNLTFPKDYNSEELAGQDVVFTVTVNYIVGEAILPELTDQFVADKTDYDNIADYRKFANEQIAASNQTKAEENIWKVALDNAEVSEYDEDLLKETKKSMEDYYKSMAEQYGMELSDFLEGYFGMTQEQFEDQCETAAKAAVKEKMVSEAILSAEKIEITDDVYQDKLKEYTKEYGFETQEELEKNVEEEDIRSQITVDLAKQLVFDNAKQ